MTDVQNAAGVAANGAVGLKPRPLLVIVTRDDPTGNSFRAVKQCGHASSVFDEQSGTPAEWVHLVAAACCGYLFGVLLPGATATVGSTCGTCARGW
ncbi:MAG: hypothetical protein WCA30_06860 [Dermatophilaceae bacterium]